jgi:hypothetical protein
MRSAFTNPDEAQPYSYEEFPKEESDVSEFTGHEGIEEFKLKGFGGEAQAYLPVSDDKLPVVKPAILQDFKDVLPPA